MPDQSQIYRHWLLLRTLSARRQGATLKELADLSGVSSKTILRDLATLQEIGFALTDTISDHGRKHWKLADATGLAQLKFTLEEAAALYLGRQFLEPLAGTYFFSGAQQAFQKIRATLGDAQLRHLEKLAAAFYHKSHGLANYSRQGQLIDELTRAIEDRRLTVITYYSLNSTEPVTLYDIHPYGLVWHRQALYLIAWSCDHDARRIFKVDRIRSATVEQLQFNCPADFDLEDFLAGSFGIFHSDAPSQQISVRFSANVARVLQEKTFHPSQQLTVQPDGSLLARFALTTTEEFRSWILSFGRHAEVLEPVSLREEVRMEADAILSCYPEHSRRIQRQPVKRPARRGLNP